MGPLHSELHYSPSHVGPPHCEKCGSATFRISLSGRSAAFLTLQPQLSELLESCQQWKLTFLSTVAYRATKIPTTLRVDVPVAIRATKNLEGTMLPVNYRSWQRSFSELPILSTVGVDIPVDYSFKSYKSCQQWELTFLSTVAFRATKSRQL